MTDPQRICCRWIDRLIYAAGLAGLAGALPAAAAVAAAPLLGDMADMSIEELANIQIISVSRKPEPLAGADASVFVITAEDIRRAGAASLPEALRLAPNLQVGQVSAAGYAISARGLNGSNNSVPNKMQVLIDGRSVYTPLFSGVFWDAQDAVMEDIARIEVISGPGGTLWGVNAVNGVINIITRAARDTHGALLAAGAGSAGADAAFRYGARSGGADWRVYGKQIDGRRTELAGGGPVEDARRQSQVGFRADWEGRADSVTVHGDAYRGVSEQPAPGTFTVSGTNPVLGDIRASGVNLTGAWRHALDGGGDLALQAYLERNLRTVPPTFREAVDIADLQLQHTLPALGRHAIVWGASYRRTWDRVGNSDIVAFLPANVRQSWASLFGQDDIALGAQLALTVGARIERNPYTGREFLPTIRLSWKPAPSALLWAAASRTVRAPSRLDADAYVPGHPPYLLRGGPVIRSEVARVFELGYRSQPLPGLSYSVTAFHNLYDHLRTQEIDPGYTYVTFGNLMQGKASGVEMWGSLQASARWRLSAGLTALRETMWLMPGSNDAAGPGTAGKDPAHTLQLRSTFDLSDGQQLEVALRQVGALANPAVPGYTALDAHYLWKLRPGLELSLAGQNLNGGHGEYGPVATRTEVGRSVALRLVWRQ